MTLGKTLAHRLTDYRNPRSLGRRLRARRMALLLPILEEIFRTHGAVRMLDLGGTVTFWNQLPPGSLERLKLSITLVNLPKHLAPALPDAFQAVTGDACALTDFDDQSFDLVHSNSVIEHVGDFTRMQAFAAEVHRLAPRHFIQTPDGAFPVEPHCMTPLFHWLPRRVRIALVQRFALGHWHRAHDATDAETLVDSARLLSRRQMGQLFPSSTILRERFLGFSKSLIAVR